MARKTTYTSLREISEINLTPLMDLTFILLISFIITYPLIEQGVAVDLPRGDAASVDRESTRTVTVAEDGSLFLDDLPIDRSDLLATLQMLGASMPDITIYVRADQNLQYGAVMDVMQMLKKAQITRMALITQPES